MIGGAGTQEILALERKRIDIWWVKWPKIFMPNTSANSDAPFSTQATLLQTLIKGTSPVSKNFFGPLAQIIPDLQATRICLELPDEDWLSLGVLRVLHEVRSGRGFLQEVAAHLPNTPDFNHFFATLRSERRLTVYQEAVDALSAKLKPRLPDDLANSGELDGFDVYAADGHWHRAGGAHRSSNRPALVMIQITVKSLLKELHPIKGFVYASVRRDPFIEEVLRVEVRERKIFSVGWADVYGAVRWVVDYGLKHRDLTGVTAIGVDEVHVGKRDKFWTMVYQIDDHCKRLLWIGPDRTEKTFDFFFESFGHTFCSGISFICSDMWKPYLNAAARWVPGALRIFDRFHIVKNLNKAIEGIRREETRARAETGLEPLLKKMRWAFLSASSHAPDRRHHPAHLTGLPAGRNLSALLDLFFARLGGPLLGRLVLQSHALPLGAAEENGPFSALPPLFVNELFPRQKTVFQRCR